MWTGRRRVGLTRQQINCLKAIEAHQTKNGLMPTNAELQAALGLTSRSAVHRLLVQLETRGSIVRTARRARAISIRHTQCPHCGGELP